MTMFELGIESSKILAEEIRVAINQLPADRRQHFLDRLKICQAFADRGVEGDDAIANVCFRELRVDVGLELLRANVGLPALEPVGRFEPPGPPPPTPPTMKPPTDDREPDREPKPTPFPTVSVVLGTLAAAAAVVTITLFATKTISLVMEPVIEMPQDTGPAPLLLDHLWMN